MSDRVRPDEQMLDLPEDEGLAGEHLDNQVQRAHEQLLALKRQQEAIERQKRELEELGRRQEQLQQGKAEMVEKFTRSLVVLERESYDAQKRVETLSAIHESFSQHLDILEAINPKALDNLDMNRDLIKSLSAVDDARAEYARSLPKISLEKDGEDVIAPAAGYRRDLEVDDGKDFTYWLQAGFAFTLPLFAVGVILIIVLVAVFNR